MLHLATSIQGGAGIAARRISQATSVFSQSDILTRESLDLRTSKSRLLFQYKKGASKLVSVFQTPGGIGRNSLMTPLSVSFYSQIQEWLNNSSWNIIHLHATYNFLRTEDVTRLLNFCDRIVITLHDERFFTGGCHYSMGCKNFTKVCVKCPQIRGEFRGLVKREHREALRFGEIFKKVDIGVSAPSLWLAENAKQSALLSGLDVKLIRNCVPQLFFKSSSTDLSKTPRRTNLVTLGFISQNLNNPYKGLGTLLGAYRSLRASQGQQFTLKLLGHGLIPSDVSNVTTCTSNSDLETQAFLRSIDILIVPSMEDNLPNVILEALASGKVVIGSQAGGIPEILSEFKMPTFTPGNQRALKEAIEGLNLRDFDSEDVRSKAFERFGPEVVARDLFSFYGQRS